MRPKRRCHTPTARQGISNSAMGGIVLEYPLASLLYRFAFFRSQCSPLRRSCFQGFCSCSAAGWPGRLPIAEAMFLFALRFAAAQMTANTCNFKRIPAGRLLHREHRTKQQTRYIGVMQSGCNAFGTLRPCVVAAWRPRPEHSRRQRLANFIILCINITSQAAAHIQNTILAHI